ncbi:MAG TPA: hypothetical protein VKB43_12105 [Gaiellaceae bacterium]|nr:hypothetical protein [Gaiellaceae bacterium]
MKSLRHPATIIASVALFVALGGGAIAATGLISGSQIKNNSIPVNKLTKSAITALGAGATNESAAGNTVCPPNTTEPPTFCGIPATIKFDKKTAVLVNASLDLASTDGNEAEAQLGVCYAKHGSTSLVMVQHVSPDFVAPDSSYFAQGVTGFVGNLAAGKYDVGLCLQDETDNMEDGRFTISMLTTEIQSKLSTLKPPS